MRSPKLFFVIGAAPGISANDYFWRAVMSSTAIRHDNFDNLVVSELETLWKGEQRLGRLYPQLQRKPQLRELFLRQLSTLQQRAEHLQTVLKAGRRPVKG
jgi:hypothetical protein